MPGGPGSPHGGPRGSPGKLRGCRSRGCSSSLPRPPPRSAPGAPPPPPPPRLPSCSSLRISTSADCRSHASLPSSQIPVGIMMWRGPEDVFLPCPPEATSEKVRDAHTHTHAHTYLYSLCLCLSLSLSHTHTYTHSLFLSLSLSLSHTQTHNGIHPHTRNTASVFFPSCLRRALLRLSASSCISGPQGCGITTTDGGSSSMAPRKLKTLGGLGPLGMLSLLVCTAAASAGLCLLSNASLRSCRGLGYGEAEAAEVLGEWARGAYGFLGAAEDLSPNIGECATG